MAHFHDPPVQRRARRTARHAAEALEPRRLLAAIAWDGGGDGTSWTDAGNWTTGVPTLNDDVTIDVPGTPTIRLSNAQAHAKSLVCAEQMLVARATLHVHGDARLDGTITLGDSALPTPNSMIYFMGTFSWAHQITGDGTIEFAGGNAYVFVDTWQKPTASLSIGEDVTVRLTGPANGLIRQSDLNGTITNKGSIEAGVAGGRIEIGFLESSGGTHVVQNQGRLSVADGATLGIAGKWSSPAGSTIDVTGGTFLMQGQLGSADFASINRTGGNLVLQGSISLAGGPLALNAKSGSLRMEANSYIVGPGQVNASQGAQIVNDLCTLIDVTLNAPVSNGTFGIVAARGSLKLNSTITGGQIDTVRDGPFNSLDVVAGGDARLSGVTVKGTVNVAEQNAVLHVINGLTLNGTVNVTGTGTRVVADGTQSWSGAGTVALANDSAGIAVQAAGAPATLTLNTAVRGFGQLTAATANTHPATFANARTVTADVSGQTLVVQGGGDPALLFTNQSAGTVGASNGGTLRFDAAPTNYAPASRELSGGTWSVGPGSSLLFPPGLDIASNAATVLLDGAASDFPALAPLAQNKGTLQLTTGRDLAAAPGAADPFVNSGLLKLGAGSELSVDGGFAQAPAGILHTVITGATSLGRVLAGGAVSLDGTVRPELSGAYLPDSTTVIEIVHGASRSGVFATVSPVPRQGFTRGWNARYDATSAFLSVSASAPGVPDMLAASDLGTSSTDNTTSDATPTFTGTAPADAVGIVLYIDDVAATTAAVSGGAYTVTAPVLLDGFHSARARTLDAEGDESQSPLWINFMIDTAAATAALSTPPVPAGGAASTTFKVTFVDGIEPFDELPTGSGVVHASLGTGDVRVTGPNGFDQLATLVSVNPSSGNGLTKIVTYRIDAPGGAWDAGDDAGDYEMRLESGQVNDVAGNTSAGQSLGHFSVPLPDWLAPGSAASWDPVARTLTLTGAATIVADPGPAAAVVVKASGLAGVLTIDPSDGREVHLASLNLSHGATATLASLGAARTATNHRVLVVDSLNIDSDSKLDLTDNDLVLNYAGVSPVGDVEADVRAGYNVTGDWLGKGITSSIAQLDGNYAIAVADNAMLAAPFGTAQGGVLFSGVDVDLTTVLIKFTHRADVDLDGVITANDSAIFGGSYSEGDFANWATGDMDYDGLFTPTDAAIFGGFYDESLPSM